MAPFEHLARGLVSVVERAKECTDGGGTCLDDEGRKGIKIVIPATIGGIVAVAVLAVLLVWGITRCRMKKREKKFWERAEVRNSLRQSRAMALADQGLLATRDSVATLSTLGSGISGPQVYDSHLLPSMPTERSLRASMMSMNSSYSSPYDSSPLARSARSSRIEDSARSSRIDDPWDTRSDVDPGEAVPMLNRSPRPSLSINTGSGNPPAYNMTYMISHEYPQVSEPSAMRNVTEPSIRQGQYAAVGEPEAMNSPARAAAVAAAAAQLEGHDYEYAQAATNAAAAATAYGEEKRSSYHASHEAVRSDGGHVRPSSIVQVVSTSPVRQKSTAPQIGSTYVQ